MSNAETKHLNAQGSRVITVLVYVGIIKIYGVPAEAPMKKERPDETQLITKIVGFLSFTLVKC